MARVDHVLLLHRQAEPQAAQEDPTGTQYVGKRSAPSSSAFGLKVARQAQEKIMAEIFLDVCKPLLAQRRLQALQMLIQLRSRELTRQQATYRLRAAWVLRPLAAADLPQMQWQLPAQVSG
nr:hypothetical protein [Pseudomonas fluorescens]